MPFIRAKQHRAALWREDPVRTYYYLVESYRDAGKVRQRTLAYLGRYPTVKEALTGLPAEIECWKNDLLYRHRQLEEAKADYDAALGVESSFSHADSGRYTQRLYRARLKLCKATKNYRRAEPRVAWVQQQVTALEARLAKLQALSRPDCSAHESTRRRGL